MSDAEEGMQDDNFSEDGWSDNPEDLTLTEDAEVCTLNNALQDAFNGALQLGMAQWTEKNALRARPGHYNKISLPETRARTTLQSQKKKIEDQTAYLRENGYRDIREFLELGGGLEQDWAEDLETTAGSEDEENAMDIEGDQSSPLLRRYSESLVLSNWFGVLIPI